MMSYTTAYSDPSTAHVDLGKRTARLWTDPRPPVLDDIIETPDAGYGHVCGKPVADGWVCTLPADHATSAPDVPCIATRSTGYGDDIRGYHPAGPGNSLEYVLAVGPVSEWTAPTREQWEATVGAVADARRDQASAERARDAATQKISDIRDYVIARKEDGDICAAGTLRFLRYFDLPAWEQDYTVEASLNITVSGFLSADQAASYVRNHFTYDADDAHVSVSDVTVDEVTDENGDVQDY